MAVAKKLPPVCSARALVGRPEWPLACQWMAKDLEDQARSAGDGMGQGGGHIRPGNGAGLVVAIHAEFLGLIHLPRSTCIELV